MAVKKPAAKAAPAPKKAAAPAPAKKATPAPAKKSAAARRAATARKTTAASKKASAAAVARRRAAGNKKPPLVPNKSGQMTAPVDDGLGAQGNYVPGEEEYLGYDPDYQDFLAESGMNTTRYMSDLLSRRNKNVTSEADQLRQLTAMKPKETESLNEDYAARGLLQSGIFANSLKSLGTEQTARESSVRTAAQREREDLNTEEQTYGVENLTANQRAKQAAIRRRALTYGLPTGA